MFKGKWVSVRTRSYLSDTPYWATVYVIEKHLHKFPIEVINGRSSVEFDRLYMLSWWENVRLGFWLHFVQNHPVFGSGRKSI